MRWTDIKNDDENHVWIDVVLSCLIIMGLIYIFYKVIISI